MKSDKRDALFSAQAPVVVHGLGRHLELQMLAKRLKEEEADRASRAFIANPRGASTQFTVPQPFNLTEARDQVRNQEESAKCRLDPNLWRFMREGLLLIVFGKLSAMI